jgi:hypothetical protein
LTELKYCGKNAEQGGGIDSYRQCGFSRLSGTRSGAPQPGVDQLVARSFDSMIGVSGADTRQIGHSYCHIRQGQGRRRQPRPRVRPFHAEEFPFLDENGESPYSRGPHMIHRSRHDSDILTRTGGVYVAKAAEDVVLARRVVIATGAYVPFTPLMARNSIPPATSSAMSAMAYG